MSHSPLYNSSNLDYTGSKSNNPYSLIQKAGKKKRTKKQKMKTKTKRRQTKKSRSRSRKRKR